MKIASTTLRVVLTLALGWAEWTLIAQPQDFTPHWTILSLVAFLLVVWAVLFIRLRSPLAGMWALALLLALLLAVTLCTGALLYGYDLGSLPDWTLFLFVGGVILAWLLLLRIRVPDPWESTKRVVHALVWIWLSLMAAAIPASVYSALSEHSEPLVSAAVFAALLLGSAVLSYYAIRGRWSLTWPLLVLFVLTWPFGVSVPIIVGLIGLGKLIIQAVGRGGTLAASDLQVAVVEARPRGMVESANYE
jgi:hypothetical protein